MSLKPLLFIVSCVIACAGCAKEAQQVACPGVEKLSRDRLYFTYPTAAQAGQAFYYAKALPDSNADELSLQDILSKGLNLQPLPKTTPQHYQIPGDATKLYILQSAKALEETNSAALITLAQSSPDKSHKQQNSGDRNASNYVHDLPPEYLPHVAAMSSKALSVCELAL